MEVIGKKTVKHIQAGDVIGLIGDHIHYTLDPVERLTTVISVEKIDRSAIEGAGLNGKYYLITCSDGNIYRLGGYATKYAVYSQEVK